MRIDITVGPSWPAAVSTITPDDDAACTELAHGQADRRRRGDVRRSRPEPAVLHAEDAVTEQTLVALQAAPLHRRRPTRACCRRSTPTPTSTCSTRSSTAASPGRRRGARRRVVGAAVLLAARIGPGARGRAAHHAPVVRRRPLQRARLAGRRRPVGGPGPRPRAARPARPAPVATSSRTRWRSRPRRPSGRRGCSRSSRRAPATTCAPWLPVVMELKEKYLYDLGTGANAATTDSLRTNQVRDDYNQVLSDLYRDHHLLPLQAFARTLGMGLRVQPYGLETDTVEHAALLDVPETESLGFKNLDDYRVMAGGRDMAGHTILSCEAICYNGAAYNTMLGGNSASPTQQNQALLTLNSIFAARREPGDHPRIPLRRRARRDLAGLRRLLALLQRRDRLRRGLGAAHPAVAAHARHRGVPLPHPARPADRHTEVRRGLPAAEGLDVHGHRRLLGDERRHPARVDPLLRDSGPARPAAGHGPRWPAGSGRSRPTRR